MLLCWQDIMHLMLVVMRLKVQRISLVFVGLVFVYFPHVETTSEISKFISSDEQPKIWMRYTEKLVSVLLAEICRRMEFRRIDTTSEPLGFCFKRYCLINKKITFLTLLKMIQTIAQDKTNKNSKLWQYRISIMLNSTIAVPIFHVQVCEYPMFVLGGERERYFLYQLHTSLRLNVTFPHFALFFKNAHDCRVASVILKQKGKCMYRTEKKCFIEEAKEDKRVRFVFCGVHSQFTNYFPRKDMLFLMKTSSHSKFHIKVQFSIMDKQTRESLPLHSSSPKFLQWTLYFPQSKSTIHKLHIKVKKYKQILIRCREISPTWSVFDGPGLDPLPLNKCVNKTLQTKGFQLTVYIFANQSANASTVSCVRYSEQMQRDLRSVFLGAPDDSQFIECICDAYNASVTIFSVKSLDHSSCSETTIFYRWWLHVQWFCIVWICGKHTEGKIHSLPGISEAQKLLHRWQCSHTGCIQVLVLKLCQFHFEILYFSHKLWKSNGSHLLIGWMLLLLSNRKTCSTGYQEISPTYYVVQKHKRWCLCLL